MLNVRYACRSLKWGEEPPVLLARGYTLHVDIYPECHYNGGHVKNVIHI
jgi:hypothetical protein